MRGLSSQKIWPETPNLDRVPYPARSTGEWKMHPVRRFPKNWTWTRSKRTSPILNG